MANKLDSKGLCLDIPDPKVDLTGWINTYNAIGGYMSGVYSKDLWKGPEYHPLSYFNPLIKSLNSSSSGVAYVPKQGDRLAYYKWNLPNIPIGETKFVLACWEGNTSLYIYPPLEGFSAVSKPFPEKYDSSLNINSHLEEFTIAAGYNGMKYYSSSGSDSSIAVQRKSPSGISTANMNYANTIDYFSSNPILQSGHFTMFFYTRLS